MKGLPLLLALVVAVGCQTVQPDAPAPRQGGAEKTERAKAPAAPRSELVVQLLRLANQALEKGEYPEAQRRYRRVLALEPDSSEAHLGLARLALAEGDLERARVELGFEFDSRSEIDPGDVDLAVTWAEIAAASGDEAAARRAIYVARRAAPLRYDVAGRLEALGNELPEEAARDDFERLQRAVDHPFSPAILVEGASAARARGSQGQARSWLEEAIWLADVDSGASQAARLELASMDPQWAKRTIVRVHVYADQRIRAEPGWKIRMRLLWRSLSVALDPLLGVAFVPVTLRGFETQRGRVSLTSINDDFRATAGVLPREGLIAALTQTPAPKKRGPWRLGQAIFFGRELVARLNPGEIRSRVLVHELLHLYGGVHVTDEVGSLMNPAGQSLAIDPANVAILELTRNRRFERGNLAHTVLPFVDRERLAGTYMEWLRFHLGIRQSGMEEAKREARTSRFVAAAMARKTASLDTHMADVATLTAQLLLSQGAREEAADLYFVAGRLYGPGTALGREMSKRAQGLRGTRH